MGSTNSTCMSLKAAVLAMVIMIAAGVVSAQNAPTDGDVKSINILTANEFHYRLLTHAGTHGLSLNYHGELARSSSEGATIVNDVSKCLTWSLQIEDPEPAAGSRRVKESVWFTVFVTTSQPKEVSFPCVVGGQPIFIKFQYAKDNKGVDDVFLPGNMTPRQFLASFMKVCQSDEAGTRRRGSN